MDSYKENNLQQKDGLQWYACNYWCIHLEEKAIKLLGFLC